MLGVVEPWRQLVLHRVWCEEIGRNMVGPQTGAPAALSEATP